MVNALKKYWPTAVFVYLILFSSLTSTWWNEAIPLPTSVTRIAALLVYLPFVLCIGWKVFTDLREKAFPAMLKNKDLVNITFYVFAFYYAVITVYRFFAGMEVKENLYYSLVFFGSIALYLLHRGGKLPCTKEDLTTNLFAIASTVVIYHFLHSVIGYRFFAYPTVNINITSGIIAMLLPFLMRKLWQEDGTWWQKIYKIAVCIGVLVVIAATGSRAIFWLTLVSVFVALLCSLGSKEKLLKTGAVLVGVCLIFGTMVLVDVGNVRSSLCRETGISYDVLFKDDAANGNPPSTSGDVTTQPPEDNKNQTQEQVQASNYMRAELVKSGIEQFFKNPWIGTGDVTYTYRVGEYVFEQSSHNFILEALVCYGVIGMLFIVVLLVGILLETKLFSKNTRKNWRTKVVFLLSMMVFFGLGMVQPTVFDLFMCPVFVLLVAKFKGALANEEKDDSDGACAEDVSEPENKELSHVS